MGEILGLGMTHFPPLTGPDENLGRILQRALRDPALPEQYRQPSGWPAAMRQEYGDDQGKTAAARHREFLVTQFRKARQILDDFQPDFILLWGDSGFTNLSSIAHSDLGCWMYEKTQPSTPRSEH